MNKPRPSGFSHVDQEQDISFFIEILKAQDRQPGILGARARALELLDPQPGWRVLDAGCGLGTAACEIVGRVGSTGSVVALDVSERMLEAARHNAAACGIALEFAQGDVTKLDFGDASFDGARAERVLQHVDAPERALAEMIRVVRPGGRIAVVDTDWSSIAPDLPDESLVAKLRAAQLQRFASPTIGRRLYGMFKRANLADVAVEPIPVLILGDTLPGTDMRPGEMTVRQAVEDGALSAGEGETLLAQMRDAAEQDALLMTLTMYAVGGTKA